MAARGLDERFGTNFTEADQLFFDQIRASAENNENPSEAAYARSDLFERRRRLMDDWASAIESK